MAARLRAKHQEDVKAKIKTTLLLGRLHDHIFAELELSASQIKAIEILLSKVLSDAPRQIEGQMTNENFIYHISDRPKSADEWQSKYGDSMGTAIRTPDRPN